MPYQGIPKHLWPKMERCVAKVKAEGGKVNAYAVCAASILRQTKSKKRRKR